MDALVIEGTNSTPSVRLYPNGELYFKGRSLPEDPISFYNPILEWITSCKSENITTEFCLEYMSTSSSKQVYTILCKIKDNPYVNNIKINWMFEEGDDDNYDTGLDFQELTQLPFHFEEYTDAI